MLSLVIGRSFSIISLKFFAQLSALPAKQWISTFHAVNVKFTSSPFATVRISCYTMTLEKNKMHFADAHTLKFCLQTDAKKAGLVANGCYIVAAVASIIAKVTAANIAVIKVAVPK
jgi:hypothetical protein